MDSDFILLKKEFERIKNMGFVKSLRKGPTGFGYTFETLLGKKEDQECKPDFRSIEIKCKLAYLNDHMTLFSCAPKRDNGPALNYIFENYHFPNLVGEQIFSLKIFSRYTINKDGFEFRLFVDYVQEKVFLNSYLDKKFIENICYWDFQVLKEKIITKLSNLAIVEYYPHNINNELFIKYTNITFYKLKDFETFLQLLNSDVICVEFSLKKVKDASGMVYINTHGVLFRIRKENIEKLFTKIIV